MLSENWIYNKIFGLSEEEIAKEKANIIEDTKQTFRKDTIESEGQDPANPPNNEPIESDDNDEENNTSFEEYGKQGGQKKDVASYGKSQDSARGRDPLGKETRSIHRENFIKSLSMLGKTKTSLLSENNILDDSAL